MATRQGDSEALAARCKKAESIGWRVEDTPDGWKVFDRRGGMWSIHKTYSDHRALINNVKDIENKGGLKADETEMRAKRLAERKQALIEDRNAADRRAIAKAAQQQELLVKAAGPYMAEIEEVDVDWMTKPHPAPWMRWMYLTPKVAQYIIDNNDTDNRKPAPSQIDRYKLIILSDQWHLTHQGLAFDTRGVLQDGGHRCRAVAAAGEVAPDVKVPFAVFVGMPPENFKAIDEGRLRSAAQLLNKAGIAGGTHAVTMLRAVSAFDSDDPRAGKRGKLTNVQAFELLGTDPDGFADAIAICNKGYKRTNITPGIMASAYYLIMRANGQGNPIVKAFFDGLIAMRKVGTDFALPPDDPRQVLLTRFANTKPLSVMDGIIWIIVAWNNVARGNHPRQMRIPTYIPDILTVVPGKGVVPRALDGEVQYEGQEKA